MRQRFRTLLGEVARAHISTGRLAIAVGVGVLVGCSPFYGMHFLIGGLLARVLRLNQLAVLLGEQIALPFLAPFVIFASVETGHLALYGQWLALDGLRLGIAEAQAFFASWLLGGLLFGAALGTALSALAYGVLRRVRAADRAAWSGRSQGSAWGYALFLFTLRLLGRRGGYLLLYCVLPYYFVFARRARRASRLWLDTVLGPRPFWVRQRDTWRHLHAFSRSLIDEALIMLGRGDTFSFTHDGAEHITRCVQAGRGAILLSAHLGSRAVGGRRLQAPINLVMYAGEAASIRALYARSDKTPPNIIEVNDGPSASVRIINTLRKGEIVAMLADRSRSGPTLTVSFFGRNAQLPKGPFLTALVSGSPVVFTFGAKASPTHHRFWAHPPIQPAAIPRGERQAALQTLANAYAAALEQAARAHPYQWYNFYDFWAAPTRE